MDLLRRRQGDTMPFHAQQSGESDTAITRATSIPSSPTSSEGSKTADFLRYMKDRARRPFSRDSPPLSMTPMEPPGGGQHGRRPSKSLAQSAAFELLSRRNSGFSDDRSSVSRTPTTLSTSSVSSVDWRSQRVEGFAQLEPDSHLSRHKTPHIVVTSGYIVKVRRHSDAIVLFPQLAKEAPPGIPESAPEPLLVIPIGAVVSVFATESARYPFGFEVWWQSHNTTRFRHACFFFPLLVEREEQMDRISNAIRANNDGSKDLPRYPWEVEGPIRRLFAAEEPKYQHHRLEIFPVVPRGATRKNSLPKSDDKSPKSLEGHSFYLAIGANLCFYIEICKGTNKRGEVSMKHSSFGLITLERFQGDWAPQQEEFNITFRDPFKAPVTLELASRYYRQIIRVFGKADRCLKPAWPQTWQNLEIFRISELKEPQYLVPRGNYGSVHRTLDAYTAAYRCKPVDWEVNWRTQFAPEFRLLPSKDGARYSHMQLLAVLRALRYNDYFRSLSFRDVDLSVLFNCFDRYSRRSGVAYLSRSCVALGADEIEALHLSPVLQNEFHALAFCAETIRQIDFSNTFRAFPARAKNTTDALLSVQFLPPILNLLESTSAKCNNLILSGNALGRADVTHLVDSLKMGRLQGLDVSRCGLSDMDLRDLFEAIGYNAHPVQLLDISGNLGRIPATMLPNTIGLFMELRELNLYGTLLGAVQGPLLPFEALDNLVHLQELDISHSKVNEATLYDLERYLLHRTWRLESDEGAVSNFRRLVLNNCGITGKEASKLFNAIGEDHGLHMFLSGNPLEDGIGYLAHAIQHSRGPAGLHMDMIEFRDERNYALLMNALTVTEHLSLLSLVGTAPTPSPNVPCSEETLRTVEDFFSRNKSVSYLDLSGYCGKLDEGQLAKGFGHALQGLARNETLTHLWIRNQNLHEDVGTLGTVLRQNRTLMMFDCQGNGFNLTSLQFLVQALKDNCSIVEFPLSPGERDRIWQRVLVGWQQHPEQKSTLRLAKNRPSDQESALRKAFEQNLAELDGYLDRNLSAQEQGASDETWNPGTSSLGKGSRGRWPMELQTTTTTTTTTAGKDASRRPEEKTAAGTARRRGTVRSSAISINTSDSTPYHVRPEEGMESPTDTVGSASVTPPEPAGPGTPEDLIFQRVMQNLKENEYGDV